MILNSSHSPKFHLYSLHSYDRSAKVRWVLTELNLKYETQWLNREEKEHESPKFLKINPMGRVPVLEIDGQVIFESGAICAYLGDLFSNRSIAPPIDSPERAKYQQWMYFAASTIDVFQTRIMVIEDIPPGEVQQTKQSILQSDLRDALSTLDYALTNQAYLVGNRFTVADICVSYHLYWCRFWPELDVVFQDFPRVKDYLERMKTMPSAVKAEVFSFPG
jgi:glutathione S-transferase